MGSASKVLALTHSMLYGGDESNGWSLIHKLGLRQYASFGHGRTRGECNLPNFDDVFNDLAPWTCCPLGCLQKVLTLIVGLSPLALTSLQNNF